MRLLRLELRDFLSYEELDLDFSGVGVVAIVGANGAGKSSLLDAVLWSVWGEGRASADDLVREGTLSCWVRSSWEIDGQTVEIARTRSKSSRAGESSLDLYVDGARATRHTIAETQGAILRLIRMGVRSILAGPFMVQGRSDELMRARPAERKDLLVDIFGLGHFEQYHDEARERLALITSRIKAADRMLEEEQVELAEEAAVTQTLAELQTQKAGLLGYIEESTGRIITIREEASALAERAKRAEQLAAEIEDLHKRSLAAHNRLVLGDVQLGEVRRLVSAPLPEITVPEPSRSAVGFAEESLAKIESDLLIVQALTRRVPELQARVDELEVDLAGQVCEGAPDTCRFLERCHAAERQIDHARQQLAEALASQPDLLHLLEAQIEDRSALAQAKRAYDAAVQERHAQEVAQARAESRLPTLQAQAKTIEDSILAELSFQQALERDITTKNAERLRLAQDEYRAAEVAKSLTDESAVLTGLKENLSVIEPAIATLTSQLARTAEAHKKIAKLGTELEVLRANEALYTELAKAFHRDGIPTMILESSLPIIEDRANEILARMPGGYSVRMDTQRETKSRTMRETLDVVVQARGLDRSYDLLSGGERFRIDFALRLGLDTAMGRQSGHPVETLFLDEGWGSQDPGGRNAMLESISAVADEFGLILLVSHIEEVTSMIPSRLEVSKNENDISSAAFA